MNTVMSKIFFWNNFEVHIKLWMKKIVNNFLLDSKNYWKFCLAILKEKLECCLIPRKIYLQGWKGFWNGMINFFLRPVFIILDILTIFLKLSFEEKKLGAQPKKKHTRLEFKKRKKKNPSTKSYTFFSFYIIIITLRKYGLI